MSFDWKKVFLTATAVPLLAMAVVAASLPTQKTNPKEPAMAPAVGAAQSLSQAFRDTVKSVRPAVVLITSESAIPVKMQDQEPDDEDLSPDSGLGELPFGRSTPGMPDLGKFFRGTPHQTPKHGHTGMGSGLVIDASGIILTNNHVVSGGGRITVRLQDGREYKAAKVVTDPKTDLAVVRIEGADHLTAARLGDSDAVEVGDWVLAVGHPFGLEGTVTAGIISAKGRGIGITEDENFIQTDAAINPGNSGGPLVNLDGEVIGINTAISSSSGGNEGVGFAIPINLAKWVSGQLTASGEVHRARLGVMIQPLTHELAMQFGLKSREGVLVAEVTPHSPAAQAGLKSGDVIVEFAGKTVATPQELQATVEQTQAGQAPSVAIVRDGKRMTLKASPAETPAEKTGSNLRENGGEPTSRLEKLGLEVQTLTPELAKQLEIQADHGVVVTNVAAGSLAERAGLAAGMVIAETNRKPLKTADDLVKALDEKSMAKGVLLLVKTSHGSRFLVIHG